MKCILKVEIILFSIMKYNILSVCVIQWAVGRALEVLFPLNTAYLYSEHSRFYQSFYVAVDKYAPLLLSGWTLSIFTFFILCSSFSLFWIVYLFTAYKPVFVSAVSLIIFHFFNLLAKMAFLDTTIPLISQFHFWWWVLVTSSRKAS